MSLLAKKLEEAQAVAPTSSPMLAKLEAKLAQENPTLASWDSPETWDWSVDPEPPVYLVAGLIEVGTITVLSADTGAGKSWFAMAMAMSVATGRQFLGRDVRQGVVVVIDEENPKRIPHSRLRALGMTNDHSARLVYYNRKGFAVGEAATNLRLIEKLKASRADLLVLDTLMAATSIKDINSNDEVVTFYKSLRAVTEATGVSVLILHHERKTQQGQRAGTGQSSMGARQIAGQADGHLTLQLKEKAVTERSDGGLDYRTVLVVNDAKDRDGATITASGERIVIESYKDADRRLVDAAVLSEGSARTDSEALTDGVLAQIVEALTAEAGEMKRAQLAAALSRKPDDRSFTNALKAGEADGKLIKPRYGYYALGDGPVM